MKGTVWSVMVALLVLASCAICFAEDVNKIECEAGICTKWVMDKTVSETNVAGMISDYESELTFLNNLPNLSVKRAKMVYGILERMMMDNMSWENAKQQRVDEITEVKEALENRTTDTP